MLVARDVGLTPESQSSWRRFHRTKDCDELPSPVLKTARRNGSFQPQPSSQPWLLALVLCRCGMKASRESSITCSSPDDHKPLVTLCFSHFSLSNLKSCALKKPPNKKKLETLICPGIRAQRLLGSYRGTAAAALLDCISSSHDWIALGRLGAKVGLTGSLQIFLYVYTTGLVEDLNGLDTSDPGTSSYQAAHSRTCDFDMPRPTDTYPHTLHWCTANQTLNRARKRDHADGRCSPQLAATGIFFIFFCLTRARLSELSSD